MALVKELAVRNVESLKLALSDRVPDGNGVGCFLCRLILEDLSNSGKLTGAPYDGNNNPDFPPAGKVEHLKLEGFAGFV